MTRRTRTALIAGVLVAALLVIGAGYPAKRVPPERWATSVCTTVNEWVGTTEAGADRVKESLSGTHPNLRDVREALASYLGDTAHATTLALDGLADAGIPATPKGTKAAEGLTEGFKQIRKSLRKLEAQAEDMSIRHRKKALKQVKALNRRVNTEFNSFSEALSKLRKLDPNHKLQQAFQSEPACRALSS